MEMDVVVVVVFDYVETNAAVVERKLVAVVVERKEVAVVVERKEVAVVV